MGPIKPGDRFFRVRPSRGDRPPQTDWITVESVGRKWANFGCWRFNTETMIVDDGQFSAKTRVYRSEEDYHASVRLDALWREFRHQIDRSYTRPEKADELAILKAADALGLRLKEE
jgi:hypothetical protein